MISYLNMLADYYQLNKYTVGANSPMQNLDFKNQPSNCDSKKEDKMQNYLIDTINIIKGVIDNVNVLSEDPMSVFTLKIESLLIAPTNELIFRQTTACLKRIVEVFSRLSEKSFTTVEVSSQSLLTSVRQHTIPSESIISEYCERQSLAPNAYVSSISDVIKAK